jgi:hypothetical protein
VILKSSHFKNVIFKILFIEIAIPNGPLEWMPLSRGNDLIEPFTPKRQLKKKLTLMCVSFFHE